MMIKRPHFYYVFFLFSVMSCNVLIGARRMYKKEVSKSAKTQFTLQSSAFSQKGNIPALYTCDGDDISPPLRWSNVPKGAKSFVLICKDPDAVGKTWIHWVVFNIPASVNDFPKKVNIKSLQAVEGTNSWGKVEYAGPCPPLKKHRYIFTVYVLNVAKLKLTSKATSDDIRRAMKGKVIAKAVLIGTYERPTKR